MDAPHVYVRAWALGCFHSPSIAFRYLPLNSARFSYATEGQRPPKVSGTNMNVEAT